MFVSVKTVQRNRASGMDRLREKRRKKERERGRLGWLAGRQEILAGVDVGVLSARQFKGRISSSPVDLSLFS